MRIAFVSQEYPPETAHGGIATQTWTKARGMAARGHEVYVVASSTDERRHAYEDEAVHVTRIPGFDSRMQLRTEAARWLTYSTLVAAEVSDLQARVGLDLMDFPEYGAEAYLHLVNRGECGSVRTSIHLQGPLIMLANTIGWPEKESELYRIGTHMESTCLRLADAIYSSSACSVDWCARHYGISRDAPVIHCGVDTRVFMPKAAPEQEPRVLFVGRIAASKGVDTLLDAVCRIARDQPRLRLRLVGRAEEIFARALQARAEAQGFEGLELAGFVAREHMREELVRAQIFAAPSRYEGGPGFVYLEAIACGLPVIACSGSGASEILEHGRTGFLVPPDDTASLARQLQQLLANRELRHEVGARARAHVLAEADSERCADRLESFYLSAAENAR